ncbi:MAG: hypothetical protein ACRYGK_00370 [Janthinobacterium lividum]
MSIESQHIPGGMAATSAVDTAAGAAVATLAVPASSTDAPAASAGHGVVPAGAVAAASVFTAPVSTASPGADLNAAKKLSKEEALRMFESKNPARSDAETEKIVEEAVKLQILHGTKFAAAFLEEHKVPLDVGKRVLLMPGKRRGVRLPKG